MKYIHRVTVCTSLYVPSAAVVDVRRVIPCNEISHMFGQKSFSRKKRLHVNQWYCWGLHKLMLYMIQRHKQIKCVCGNYVNPCSTFCRHVGVSGIISVHWDMLDVCWKVLRTDVCCDAVCLCTYLNKISFTKDSLVLLCEHRLWCMTSDHFACLLTPHVAQMKLSIWFWPSVSWPGYDSCPVFVVSRSCGKTQWAVARHSELWQDTVSHYCGHKDHACSLRSNNHHR
jgi:hypothetical protein